MPAMHHAIFLLICLLWGSSFILMKKAAVAFGPMTVAGGRVAGGAVLLVGLWLVIARGRRWPIRRSHAGGIALIAVVGLAYPFAIQPHLIHKHQDSAFFGMMPALVPLLTILISIPLLGIRPSMRQLIGVLGGLACLALLLDVGVSRAISAADLALGISIPTCYALSNTFAKRRFAEVHPLALTATALSSAAVLLLPLGVAGEPVRADGGPLTLAVIALLILGVLGTGLAWYLFFILIQKRGPLFAGMVTYLIPLGALAWGWADDEPITARQIVALLGVLAMTWLVQGGGDPPSERAEQ